MFRNFFDLKSELINDLDGGGLDIFGFEILV